LSGKNADNAGSSSSISPIQPPATFSPPLSTAPPTTVTAPSTASGSAAPPTQDSGCPFENDDPKKLAPKKFENEFGRLVIDEGRSRYVSNRLWASLGDEVCVTNLSTYQSPADQLCDMS
jgi:hypothetical protein